MATLIRKESLDFNISYEDHQEELGQIGDALQVEYLLDLHLTSSEYAIVNSHVAEVNVESMIWNRMGDNVWKGNGGLIEYGGNLHEMVKRTARGISNNIGNNEKEGPCESRKEVTKSAHQAAKNTKCCSYFSVFILFPAAVVIYLLSASWGS